MNILDINIKCVDPRSHTEKTKTFLSIKVDRTEGSHIFK